jgi:hypothetical protein
VLLAAGLVVDPGDGQLAAEEAVGDGVGDTALVAPELGLEPGPKLHGGMREWKSMVR